MEVQIRQRVPHGPGSFRSSRLKSTEQKSIHWTKGKAGRSMLRKSLLVVLCGMFFGLIAGLIWLGMSIFSYFNSQANYCLVMEDNFDGPLNTSLWNHEVSVGGFGNSEFEWTTTSPNNSWVCKKESV